MPGYQQTASTVQVRRGGGRPLPTSDPQESGMRWAGIVFIAAAVLSVLRVTLLKAWLPSEAGAGPVFGGAFIQAMIGLALIQGSELARKFVLVVSFLGLLGVMALLAVATLNTPELQRVAVLVWAIAAAVILPPFLALIGLLVGQSHSRLRVGICVGILAFYTLGAFWLEIMAWRAVERAARMDMGRWSDSERAFNDPGQGLSIALPEGWVLLRQDSPYVSATGARLAFGHGPTTTLATLHVEELRDGPGSPNVYLDRVREARLEDRDDFEELGREPASVGGVEGQRLTARWRQSQRRHRGWILAWQDGWRYFSLFGWTPESRADTGRAALLDLERSLQFTPVVSRNLDELMRQVTDTAPHLSISAVKALLARYPGQPLSAADLFRLGHLWSVKGLESLTPAEVSEMGQITSVLFGGIPAGPRARLGAYLEKVRFGQPTTPAEDKEMAGIMKMGSGRLPPESLQKLQTFLERGIAAATTMDGPRR